MATSDFQRDDGLKIQQRQKTEDSPRADEGRDTTLLSTLGNAAVQRLLRSASLHRQAGGGGVDDAVAQAIQAKRGSGQGLDSATRRDLEPAFGQDFAGVRVHTDGEADSLNKAVSAEAFTTGSDIFFRSGSYDPGSAEGKKLLTHELTHVVQQSGSAPSQDMTVSSPDDASERQAGEVANALSAPGAANAAVGRQAAIAREGEEDELQMSPIAREGEEDELQMSPVARQGMPEEEEVATSPIAREEMPEEEEVATSPIAREEMPEEEELATSPVAREADEEQPVPA